MATYKASYNQYGGSHGYARYTGDASGDHPQSHGKKAPGVGIGGDVQLSYIQSKAAKVKTTVRGGSSYYHHDDASSQEELAGKGSGSGIEIGSGRDGIGEIKVTKSVTVRSDVERDGESVGDKDNEIGFAKWRD